MKHRTEEEIAALILEAVVNTNRATQTIIMYKAYLSYAQLKRFLSSLLEKGLINYAKEDRLYTITEKGMRLLQVYNQLNQLQLSKSFESTNQYENVHEYMQTTKCRIGESGYIITTADNASEQARTRTTRWECQKCLRLFPNLKELKFHKVEYHSY
jgi:predicted transcriptional regulator